MTIDTVLDRLQLCNAEVTGVTRSLRLQPTKPIVPADLPLVYVRPMGMAGDTNRGAGSYFVPRRYMLVCMVGRASVASFDTSDEGSALLAAVMPFLDAFTDYYNAHPRLGTAVPGHIDVTLQSDVVITDAGPEIFKGPDGQDYAGIRPIITITEWRKPSPQRKS